MSKNNDIPNHIAIVMDGNRRWARNNKMAILTGHNYAANHTIEKITEHATKRGVKYLTFWAFSTENWQREKSEVEGLLKILSDALKNKVPSFIQKGVKLKVIGDLTKFSQDLQEQIAEAIEKTSQGKSITVVIAINYGGRDEIIRGINELLKDKQKDEGTKINVDEFLSYLDTKEIPDPDLLIRTGGEKRLSGFLTWQSVYSELYFTDVLWPDFSENDLDAAIADYQKRTRRFGK